MQNYIQVIYNDKIFFEELFRWEETSIWSQENENNFLDIQ